MYTPDDAITYLVDPASLRSMLNECTQSGAKVALIGFNEYSKNLINLANDHIVAVYESEPWKIGISFRGVPVIPLTEKIEVDRIVCCDFDYLHEEAARVVALYNNSIRYFYPPQIAYQNTDLLQLPRQERLYRRVMSNASEAPCSMMSTEKVQFLLELMRCGLKNPGAVIEMGVWQGGSSWFMAKTLEYLGETRPLFMVDLFESHAMDRTATMCNDQIARQMAFYPPATMLMGLVDDEAILRRLSGQAICFAHFDLGFIPEALDFLWRNLQPGSPLLLDNYGHIAGRPWQYDEFFKERGKTVIRFPWSEQGLVFR